MFKIETHYSLQHVLKVTAIKGNTEPKWVIISLETFSLVVSKCRRWHIEDLDMQPEYKSIWLTGTPDITSFTAKEQIIGYTMHTT